MFVNVWISECMNGSKGSLDSSSFGKAVWGLQRKSPTYWLYWWAKLRENHFDSVSCSTRGCLPMEDMDGTVPTKSVFPGGTLCCAAYNPYSKLLLFLYHLFLWVAPLSLNPDAGVCFPSPFLHDHSHMSSSFISRITFVSTHCSPALLWLHPDHCIPGPSLPLSTLTLFRANLSNRKYNLSKIRTCPCRFPMPTLKSFFSSHVIKSIHCLPNVQDFWLPCWSHLWMFSPPSTLQQCQAASTSPHTAHCPTVFYLLLPPMSPLPENPILEPDPSMVPVVLPLAHSSPAPSFKVLPLLYHYKR